MTTPIITPFETGKGKFLAVKVPDDTISCEVLDKDDLLVCLIAYIPDKLFTPGFPHLVATLGNTAHEVIGFSHELSDKQMEGICETVSGWVTPIYYNYTAKCSDYRDIVDAAFKDVKDSFRTLMDSLQCWEVNQLGEKPQFEHYYPAIAHYTCEDSLNDYRDTLAKWQQAQERTGKWLILKQL